MTAPRSLMRYRDLWSKAGLAGGFILVILSTLYVFPWGLPGVEIRWHPNPEMAIRAAAARLGGLGWYYLSVGAHEGTGVDISIPGVNDARAELGSFKLRVQSRPAPFATKAARLYAGAGDASVNPWALTVIGLAGREAELPILVGALGENVAEECQVAAIGAICHMIRRRVTFDRASVTKDLISVLRRQALGQVQGFAALALAEMESDVAAEAVLDQLAIEKERKSGSLGLFYEAAGRLRKRTVEPAP